jgi:hypothetical protein
MCKLVISLLIIKGVPDGDKIVKPTLLDIDEAIETVSCGTYYTMFMSRKSFHSF